MIFNPQELIFSPDIDFTQKALLTFRFQYAYNPVYKRFVDAINCDVSLVARLEEIPFLPISFFKTHDVASTNFAPAVVFRSSGTTSTDRSRHLVKDTALYEDSFTKGFELFYGPIKDYCILGLLPSYLERRDSSLVYMVQKLMQISGHPANGFFLTDFTALLKQLQNLQATNQKTLLIGVSYALLDFGMAYPMRLENVVLMETGGMKGRRKEMLRTELHESLCASFGLRTVHSEYGMTELLSQAYAPAGGVFLTPPWMKVLIRQEDDPLLITALPEKPMIGGLNIIDLANLYSCSFIATDDIARLFPGDRFEVLGRLDNSDIRGCSLMMIN